MEFIKFELPNGIRCIHRRVKSGVTYCGLTIGTGSRDELLKEYGMAHFTEHAMFKGTHRRKAYHINNRLENLGGELNAYTTKEETVVHSTVLNRDFAKAAELLSDVVFNSVFPQHEIDKEKVIIIDEINSYKDSPSERIYDEYEDLLWRDSQLGHNILGDKKSLKRYTTDDVRKFTSRTYNTDKIVFSCVGNISERRFRETCERYFAPISANMRTFTRDMPSEIAPFNIVRNNNTFQTHCLMGSRAYHSSDTCRIDLALLINMLGGASANSILNVAIREKNGLSYNIEAGYTPLSDTGIATIYFGTERDNLDKCIELVNNEINKIVLGGITARQLSIAKKQFVGQLYISMESNEGYMLGVGKSYLVYNEVDTLESIAERIQSITKERITEIATEIFAGGLSTLIYR